VIFQQVTQLLSSFRGWGQRLHVSSRHSFLQQHLDVRSKVVSLSRENFLHLQFAIHGHTRQIVKHKNLLLSLTLYILSGHTIFFLATNIL
jgi:hypothetical protein